MATPGSSVTFSTVVTVNAGAVPWTWPSASDESPSMSNASVRIWRTRSVRFRWLATVKSQARKRLPRRTPARRSFLKMPFMCLRRLSISRLLVFLPSR